MLKQREIPAENRESLSKGYWDRVVNRLAYLEADDALELAFSPDESITSMKSSIHTAAKRAGVRLRVVTREPRIYAWIPGKRPVIIRRAKRAPVLCEVCGGEIDRPQIGASKQFVCAGDGNEKSECQKIRRYALKHHISIRRSSRALPAHGRDAQGPAFEIGAPWTHENIHRFPPATPVLGNHAESAGARL